MRVDVEDKVVVVLGGTSGIGLALARGLRGAGAVVVPSSRDVERVRAAVSVLGDPSVPVTPCDTTDEQQLTALRDSVLERYGRVDGLVHSAGTHLHRPAAETTAAQWRHVVEVNLTGTFLAARTFGEPMLRRGAGSIVAVSSMGASVGLDGASAYCASKAGVEQLVRALAAEWSPHGVRVNALAPGFFVTDLNAELLAEGTDRRARVDAGTPMGRTGQPDELAGAVVYLCSDSAGFTSGEVLHVDGGFLAKGI